VPAAFQGGALGGLLDVRDGALVDAATNLDTFAGALRDAVNAIQTDPAGRDLDGATTTTAPIFSGTGARDLAVVLSDPRRIAAALSTQPGDNQNALRFADLRTAAPVTVAPTSAEAIAMGSTTLSSFLAGEAGRIGQDAAAAADSATASELLGAQLDAQHESLSGVSLNEELTSLLKIQHAFQASAQLLTIADRMLGELLDIV
jgi:flagellar hook-associated protein 1 FlgK